MLIADLVELHDVLLAEGKLLPPFFKMSDVHLVVELSGDGDVIGLTTTFDGARGVKRLMPDSTRAAGVWAHPICDKLTYIAALPEHPRKAVRAGKNHGAFVDLLTECRDDMPTAPAAAVSAVLRATSDAPKFLSDLVRLGAPIDMSVFSDLDIDANQAKRFAAQSAWFVAFRVDGNDVFPATPEQASVFPELLTWWARKQGAKQLSDEVGTCQVTGERGPLARLFPSTKLIGNSPKLTSGNFDAALRYNSNQSTGARVSGDVAVHATAALNWLVDTAKDDHCWLFDDLTLAWWTQDDPGLNPLGSLLAAPDDDQPGEVRELLMKSPWSGRPRLSAVSPFNVAMFTVNTSRVVVQGEHRMTLGDLQDRLSEWFGAFEAVRSISPPRWHFGIPDLARAATPTGRNASKARARMATMLLRSALFGERLPLSIRNHVVNRCAVGTPDRGGRRHHVTPEQAALLHLVAVSNKEKPVTHSAAEYCGRLLSVLEQTQDDALGDNLNRGVAASYSAAAATPQLVFPRLINKRMAHHRRLLRDKPGAAINLDRALGEIVSKLEEAGGFPAQLSPKQQSEFALGYFHQRQQRFQPRRPQATDETETNDDQPS